MKRHQPYGYTQLSDMPTPPPLVSTGPQGIDGEPSLPPTQPMNGIAIVFGLCFIAAIAFGLGQAQQGNKLAAVIAFTAVAVAFYAIGFWSGWGVGHSQQSDNETNQSTRPPR